MPKKKFGLDNSLSDISKKDLEGKEAPEEKEHLKPKDKNKKTKKLKKDEKKEYDGSYKTSFLMRPDYDDIYLQIRKKIRENLKTTISKQDALEIGLILFNNINNDRLKKIADDYPPEDNRIEELKKLLMKK